MELNSTVTCLYFYDCLGRGALLKPLKGDCCVFCSYGSVPCPPVQEAGGPCGGADEACGTSGAD